MTDDPLKVDVQKIIVRGRDGPYIVAEAFPAGLRVRLDFHGRADSWVEFCVPWEEILRVADAMTDFLAKSADTE